MWLYFPVRQHVFRWVEEQIEKHVWTHCQCDLMGDNSGIRTAISVFLLFCTKTICTQIPAWITSASFQWDLFHRPGLFLLFACRFDWQSVYWSCLTSRNGFCCLQDSRRWRKKDKTSARWETGSYRFACVRARARSCSVAVKHSTNAASLLVLFPFLFGIWMLQI